jgi:hypothetical protein
MSETPDRIRAKFEDELSWRRNEIRHFRNLQGHELREVESDYLRRAIIVLLYAHFEGFVKFLLEEYVDVINTARLDITEVQTVIAASCVAEHFKSYRTSVPGDKSDPVGARVQQVTRDATLLQKILETREQSVTLDKRQVTSADSNLTEVVLRRNLKMLGLEDKRASGYTKQLGDLLTHRNGIAHGERIPPPVNDPDFRRLEERIFKLCDELQKYIYTSIKNESYRC